jgi:5-aminolevulinate synthase
MGGYIAGTSAMVDAIRLWAAGFIFTTSLPPAIMAGAAASVKYLKEHNEKRIAHQERAQSLLKKLRAVGIATFPTQSHIVPVLVGNAVHCKMVSDMLLNDFGIYVQPINYPTVPKGTERLRFTPSPDHTDEMMDHLVDSMDKLWTMCNVARLPAVA